MKFNLDGLKVALSIAVLLIYVAYFLSALLPWLNTVYCAGVSEPPADTPDDFNVYLWTGVSVMIVGVVSVALGQLAGAKQIFKLLPETIISWYAWVYSGLGFLALILVAFDHEAAPTLIKNAATTFFGLLIPVVNSFLNPSAQSDPQRESSD